MHRSHFFLLLLLCNMVSCKGSGNSARKDISMDYRQEMRAFIREISDYTHSLDPDFLIIPQNGQELILKDKESPSEIDEPYIHSIDGIGREDLFYGYEADDQATEPAISLTYLSYLNLAKQNGLAVLVIDYCTSPSKIDDSYLQNQELGFLSFAADRRELDSIPLYPASPFSENDAAVTSLDQAHNFLYLINPAQFSSKEEFIQAVISTNYDVLVMDLFFGNAAFTKDEIEQLRHKANGGSRLVLCYLSIGEAEDYRYYWQPAWSRNPPDWLLEENPNWEGNYRVQYWDEGWKAIITGSPDSYAGRILQAGFDGVYLDLVDSFWIFEDEFSTSG